MQAWDGRESARYGLQDAPGASVCDHCGDPYDAVDEDPEPRYSGHCQACAEFFRTSDERELRFYRWALAMSSLGSFDGYQGATL